MGYLSFLMVTTRFAPSPTGFLHIGNARTALFNWLYARHHGGKFLLRVEDTDRKRSTDEAIAAIYQGVEWLGLDWDGDAISQFTRRDRHAAVAHELLEMGHAYRCYCTPEELTEMREAAKREGRSLRYDGRWRDRDPADAPAGVDPVIRLKAPADGETVLDDLIQGEVRVANAELDDMILLRADGTPTYMLAVVVDDHDMEITHVIRGDDHLTNAFRQIQLYEILGWNRPAFGHMPLLHGADGAKLSKRHGALGVSAYREMGFLPEALNNYLLRLGWSHGDDEIISREQAIEWFDLDAVGKAPSRFDMEKLQSLNSHYITIADDARLAGLTLPLIAEKLEGKLAPDAKTRINQAMPSLKERAKTIEELVDNSIFYATERPIVLTEKALKNLDGEGRGVVEMVGQSLVKHDNWSAESIESVIRGLATDQGLKLGQIAQPVRAALTGSTASPGLFEVMQILGQEETLARLDDALEHAG